MSKSEKIFDRILANILFFAVASGIIYGIIALSPEPQKKETSSQTTQQNIEVKCVHCGHKNKVIMFQSNSIPDSITIECEDCKWLNTRSLFEVMDTTNNYKNNDTFRTDTLHRGK